MSSNPYIVSKNVNIVKRFFKDGKTHVILDDTIQIDEAYNPHSERVLINGKPVKSYKQGVDTVYELEFKPDKSRLRLHSDFYDRLNNLKHISMRYLISSILWTYFNRLVEKYETFENYSLFTLKYDDDEGCCTLDFLKRLSREYIDLGLDITSSKVDNKLKTNISAIYNSNYLGPHVSNTAEIPKFDFSVFEIKANLITYKYEQRIEDNTRYEVEGQLRMEDFDIETEENLGTA